VIWALRWSSWHYTCQTVLAAVTTAGGLDQQQKRTFFEPCWCSQIASLTPDAAAERCAAQRFCSDLLAPWWKQRAPLYILSTFFVADLHLHTTKVICALTTTYNFSAWRVVKHMLMLMMLLVPVPVPMLVLASQVRAWCAQREIAVVDTTVLAALYRALCPTTAIETSDRRKKCGSVKRKEMWQIWRTGDGDEHFTKDRRVGRYTQSSIIHF
jgi:hypothetical protein